MAGIRIVLFVALVAGMAFGLAGGAQAAMGPDVPPGRITHTASSSGDWFDPATWDGGSIPGDAAWVLIPPGVSIDYGLLGSARLQTVLVQGELQFSTTASSRMRVDTLIIDDTGALRIGSQPEPVRAGTTVEIVVLDNGDIDVAWDPELLSRGLVARGQVRIHGAPKTTHIKAASDPMAGASVLELAAAPEGWQVGDVLVIAGTRYAGWRWDNDIGAVRWFGTEDEVRTIGAINGSTVTLNAPLDFDHDSPRADLKTSVANYTRNVTIRSESGATSAVHHRGHVMFQHNDDVDVRYAAFHHLGRTDKSIESFALDQLGAILPDSNVRGRYAFHFHRSGIENPADPGIAVGNAVFGSPGWGYVHHDSNAMLHDNASYDTFGAGFVAETGNEIGSWTNNIAIRAEGNRAFNPKNGNDPDTFDMARTGDGFWFQGRMVRSVGNVAASVNHGYVYLHRGSGMLSFPSQRFSMPEALGLARPVSPDDAPILNFQGNEAFASTVGVYVVKANPNQQHDIRTHMSDFTAWSVEAGAAMEYTSHYLLEDFDLVAKDPESFNDPQFGIDFGNNTSDMTVVRARIEGFETGIGLGKSFTNPTPPEVNQYVIVAPTFIDVEQQYEDFDPALDQVLNESELVPGRFELQFDDGSPFEYLDPCTAAGCGVAYTGVKADSIGSIPIPAGTDGLGTSSSEMIAVVATDGYYRTADGEPWAVIEEYFSDRVTGEIHKIGLKTRLGPHVDDRLGNPFHAWRDAFQRGVLDLDSQPSTPRDDIAFAPMNGAVVIDVLANDDDPDGDVLIVDGLVQPDHGQVFDNRDGTLTVLPDLDFEGAFTFRYWASDDQGNYSPARVTVEVQDGFVFANGFE